MKKEKKTLLIFLCGVLLGALVMGIGVMIGIHVRMEQAGNVSGNQSISNENISGNQSTSDRNKEAGEDTSTPLDTNSEVQEEEQNASDTQSTQGADTENAEAGNQDTANQDTTTVQDTWSAEIVYTGGEEVVYGGKLYRAKWWTQGERPGEAGVWEDLMIAAGQTVAPKEDAEVEPENRPARNEVGKRENFKVVGYFPSWKDNTDNIQYDVLTHINYAFAIPTAEGGLLPLENAQTAQKIIEQAHQNEVKVLIAIGGWSYHEIPLEPTFVSATETQEKRKALVEAILSLCEEYGFDGVDLDWEHPRVDGKSGEQYEAFVLELAERLHEKELLLSCAVLSGATPDGNIYYDAAAHTDKVLDAVDWINVMAYDGGDGERHSSYDFAVACGTYWKEMREMPADKVILGVPFYARPSWAAYSAILAAVPDAYQVDNTSFNGMEVWYNGIPTIEKKTAYAIENLGGIMIWEISQDASGEHSLQTAIGKMVKE